MAEGVWKGVYPSVFGRSKQLSLNKFFDPSTPSMRKGREGENKYGKKEKTDENSGHYLIASSRPPERRPLERRTLAPINRFGHLSCTSHTFVFDTFPYFNVEEFKSFVKIMLYFLTVRK